MLVGKRGMPVTAYGRRYPRFAGPAEYLVLTGTAGDYGTAGGTLNQPVLGCLVG